MIGVDPTQRGPAGCAADQGLEASARGRRLAAQAGRAAGPDLRGDLGLRAPRVRPALRGGRHPRGRPDARRGRPGGDPAGQPRRAPRRAERQHDHLRRPGHDPDGRRGLAGGRRCRTPRSSRRSSSVSAGPGTRANIDEFTRTTGRGRRGDRRRRAGQGDHHPQPGRAADDHARHDLLRGRRRTPTATRSSQSVVAMVQAVQEYVPGYRLLQEPQFDEPSAATRGQTKVAIFVEVEGAGDFLPPYAGNLDIMTAAATRVGEDIARVEPRASDREHRMTRPGRRPDPHLVRRPRPPPHRHLPARRLAPQAAPVHRAGGARHRRGARRRRRAGHRGDPRRRARRLVVQLRLLAHARAGADQDRGRDREAGAGSRS